MARPRSDAIRVIASEGLGAATAVIAKEAGVSVGAAWASRPEGADPYQIRTVVLIGFPDLPG